MLKAQEFKLICVIVKKGLGSKVMQKARKYGATGGTAFIGYGTAKKNKWWDILNMVEVEKEIVLMVVAKEKVNVILEQLNEKMNLIKPNHGIAFTLRLQNVLSTKECKFSSNTKKGSEKTMYQAIFVVVDKGEAENVVEAAGEAGAKGGTIINARGAGVHETSTVFAMEIEPEKEVVLIIVLRKIAENVINNIRKRTNLDDAGKGILFVQDVNKAYGITE